MKRSFLGVLLGLLLGLVALTGCASGSKGLSEQQIIELLPSTITDYRLDDETRTQKVSSLTIAKADYAEDTELANCEITLEDEDLTRTVYAQLSFRKYEVGGWQLEWWAPYQNEEVLKPPLPDGDDADAFIAPYGFTGIRDGEEQTSTSGEMFYEKSYIVDEAHTYASFAGTVTYRATLAYYGADAESCASYSYREEADFSELNVTWDVAGHWSGVEVDREKNDPYAHVKRLPHKYEFDLGEVEGTGEVSASGAYYYPAVYPGESEYTGEYGSYDVLSANAWAEGTSPSDATLTVHVNTYHTFVFAFTPDALSVSCQLLDYTCMFDSTRDGQVTSPETPTPPTTGTEPRTSTGSQPGTGTGTDVGAGTGTQSGSDHGTPLVVPPMQTGSDGYVLPYSETRTYTKDELSGLTAWELYIARNEIPARRGLIFGNEDLQYYFGQKDWYEPKLTKEQFRSIEGVLNPTEEANVATILEIERAMGSTYAPPEG